MPSKIQKYIDLQGYYLLFDNNSVPFNNLEFPTSNYRIQARGPHFKFGKNELKRKFNKKKNEFLLITPSHYYFLHSQFGQLNTKYLEVFIGSEVLVSNEYGNEVYVLAESPNLKPGTALIYSGLSSTLKKNPNVNNFIPDNPEELGYSGAYNSAIVKITKVNS